MNKILDGEGKDLFLITLKNGIQYIGNQLPQGIEVVFTNGKKQIFTEGEIVNKVKLVTPHDS